MKRILSVILSMVLITIGLTACAAEADTNTAAKASGITITMQIDNPVMTVNGTDAEIDPGRGTTPVIVNDRTLVPIRAIIEAMGGTVSWEQSTQTATLDYISDEIRLVIDSETAYLNDEPQTLDTAPSIINERTMLPIRFIAESFGFDVSWEQGMQTVTITKSASEPMTTAEPTFEPTAEPTDEPVAESADTDGAKSLVVYFSNTGNTKAMAETIASVTGADIYEIIPEVPYTDEDLNYNNSDCRANLEQNDDTARPAISGNVENLSEYGTIYLGYPIWWGTMPKIINTFLETYDLSDKELYPFCTSGGSSINTSVNAIREYCPNVHEGLRGTSSTDESQIKSWLGGD